MTDTADERARLQQSLDALESQRLILGDAVVEPALAALRERLAQMAEPEQPDQQRKQVTILFADVVGFTAMSESMDAEDVTDLINQIWRKLDTVIVDYGGRIDKHIGDAVMAHWGAAAAREDDPESAVRAALAMQAAIEEFCAEHQAPLTIRIGINTGSVLFGRVGTTGEFTVIGDAVNLASRLESAAPAGSILIAHDTYRHIRGVFDVRLLDKLQVKGRAEPVQTYMILRAKPRAFRMATRGIEGIETRTIGRDAEMVVLQNAFEDAVQESESRLIVVTGEAGVGKSRLMYEFENWLELRPEQISFHKGRATATFQRTRFGLFRALFALRFDILESDTAETTREKFRAGMLPVLDSDRADLVGHWLGFDFSGSSAVARLAGRPEFGISAQAHLVRYLRAILRDRPMVMFYEDIHWADDGSLDLILDLATALSNGRLLIVCNARPSLYERRPGWAEDHPAAARLNLKPLSRRFTRELVAEILQRVPSVPDELRDILVDNSEGNPFYVEELVKMLVDEDVIIPELGEWRVDAGQLVGLRVPPTLTGVLQARLDGLPRHEREILQRSAVVGRLFWDATVADLSGNDTAEVRPVFDVLRERELILHRSRSSFSGVEEYAFRHSLLREVAYETVLLRLRREYHAQVARWIENHAGERRGEYLSLIAEHYALAGQDRLAADYFERAGKQALDAGTYRAARAAYEHALTLRRSAGDPAEALVEGMVRLGAATWQLGDFAAARELLESALATARREGDTHRQLVATYYLGQTIASMGDFAAAQVLYEEALPPARSAGGEDLAQLLSGLGGNTWRLGDLDAAEQYVHEALAVARERESIALQAQAINLLGLIAGARADLDTEKACYEQCLALSRRIGDLYREAIALANLGVIAILSDAPRDGVEYLETCLEMFEDLGRRESVALNLGNLAHAYMMLGEIETARRQTREMLVISRQIGALPRVLDGLLNWAELLITTGREVDGVMLLGLIRHNPAREFQMQQEVERVLLTTTLSPEEIEAALSAGSALDRDVVVDEILAGEWQ